MSDTTHFTRTEWQFGRGGGSVINRRLRLQAGGSIQNSQYPNERYWTVSDSTLAFLNVKRTVTTRFTEAMIGPDGRRVLRGTFIPSGGAVQHLLTELPVSVVSIIPNPPPKVAVLLRTHRRNQKTDDLISVLGESGCYDLYVCADVTSGELSFDGVAVLPHRDEDARDLQIPYFPQDLLWLAGDYVFYFAKFAAPDYDYYIMMEYDVELVDRSPIFIEAIINRLQFGGSRPIDFVGCRTYQGALDKGWGKNIGGVYPEAHLCLFPFVVLSRRAIEFLLSERRAELLRKTSRERLMFCEAFVPSALNAGGFTRSDINRLISKSVEDKTFRIPDGRGPMLLGGRVKTFPTVKMIHPVYDEDAFVRYHTRSARQTRDVTSLQALLSDLATATMSGSARSTIEACIAEIMSNA